MDFGGGVTVFNLLIIIILTFFLPSCTSVKSAPVSYSQIQKNPVETFKLIIVDENAQPLNGVKIAYKLFKSHDLAKEGSYITKADGKMIIKADSILSQLLFTVEKDGFIPLRGALSSTFDNTDNIKTITMAKLKSAKLKPREMFDKAQFDFSISQLSPNYKGDDIEKVYNRVVNDMDNNVSEQVGSSNKTIYNFVLPGKKLKIIGKLKYDFESKSAKVMFNFSYMFEEGHLGKQVWNIIDLKMADNKKSSYLASNVFGATVKVKRYTGVDYGISVQNSNDIRSISKKNKQPYNLIKTDTPSVFIREPLKPFNMEKRLDQTAEEMSHIFIKFKASSELARLSLEDISILFVCKLKKPLIITGRSGHDATISHPTAMYIINKCIIVEVLDIWVFNTKSGEIYHKQPII